MWDYGFSWGGMFLMMLSMALWIALLVVLVWALIRWLDRRSASSAPSHPSIPQSVHQRSRYYANAMHAARLTRLHSSRCESAWRLQVDLVINRTTDL